LTNRRSLILKLGQGQTRPDPEFGDVRPRTAAWLNAEKMREKRDAERGIKETRTTSDNQYNQKKQEEDGGGRSEKASDRVVGWTDG
jgi:hypothetical protein